MQPIDYMLWSGVASAVRDQIPGDWKVPPLVRGPQIAALDAPDGSRSWRIWLGGKHPPAPSVQLYGRAVPPHPLLEVFRTTGAAHPGAVLIFEVPSNGWSPAQAPKGHQVVVGGPEQVVGAAVELVRRWESEQRPDRPWSSRREELAAAQEREAARLVKAAAELKLRQQRAAEEARAAQARRAGWTIRRGHHQTAPKESP